MSFFAIVLPGALLTYLWWLGFNLVGRVELSTRSFGAAGVWVAFLITAYLVGQLLFTLGSWIVDPVYDRSYRRYKERVKGDPRDLVKPLMNALLVELPRPSPFPWTRAFLRSRSSAASAEIDQIEADSKFFRSLTLVLALGPLIVWASSGPLLWACITSGALLAVVAAMMDQYADYLDRNPDLTHSASRPSHLLDAYGALSGCSIVIVIAGSWWEVLWHAGPWASVLYVALVVVSFLRFAQQRWQRNETAYESAVAIANETGDQ